MRSLGLHGSIGGCDRLPPELVRSPQSGGHLAGAAWNSTTEVDRGNQPAVILPHGDSDSLRGFSF